MPLSENDVNKINYRFLLVTLKKGERVYLKRMNTTLIWYRYRLINVVIYVFNRTKFIKKTIRVFLNIYFINYEHSTLFR